MCQKDFVQNSRINKKEKVNSDKSKCRRLTHLGQNRLPVTDEYKVLLMDSGICESCLFLKCEGAGGKG